MSGCTFILSRNSPLRTTLVDEATGQAVYEIDTPRKLSRSCATKIRKFDSPTQPPLHRNDGDDDNDSDEDDVDKKDASTGAEGADPEPMELSESSDEMARIYWKWVSSDNRIIFRGKITSRNEFLPAAGKLRGSFTFTGPDDVQYRWAMGAMGMNYPKLVTTDEKKTVIAEFHRAHHIFKKRKARLEVQPAGMHMLDYIILTFVIVERKRREREEATAIAAGAGGS